jgi:hypothetical protein
MELAVLQRWRSRMPAAVVLRPRQTGRVRGQNGPFCGLIRLSWGRDAIS